MRGVTEVIDLAAERLEIPAFGLHGLPRLTLQTGGKVFIVNAQPTSLDEYAAGVYRDLAEFAEAVLAM